MSKSIYKVVFINQGKVYEVFARQVYQAEMYGFVVVEELIFGERSTVVVDPGEELYTGQVIGENSRPEDLLMNVTKGKKLTNIRAATADDKIFITPATKYSLEESMEYIANDEYLEVTPRSLRMRKIILDEHERNRQKK